MVSKPINDKTSKTIINTVFTRIEFSKDVKQIMSNSLVLSSPITHTPSQTVAKWHIRMRQKWQGKNFVWIVQDNHLLQGFINWDWDEVFLFFCRAWKLME